MEHKYQHLHARYLNFGFSGQLWGTKQCWWCARKCSNSWNCSCHDVDIKLRPVRGCVSRVRLAWVCVVVVVVVIVRFFVMGKSDATGVAGVTVVDRGGGGGGGGCSHTTGSRKDCSKPTDEAKTGTDDDPLSAEAAATAAAGSSVGRGSAAVAVPEQRSSCEEVENEEGDWEYCDGYDAALVEHCRWRDGRGGWWCGAYGGG